MYLPPHFEQADPDRIRNLIRTCPLGMLVTAGPQGLDANHLPFILNPDRGPLGTLLCHVARANPVWRELADSQAESLAVLQGPSAYVSPSLYETMSDAPPAFLEERLSAIVGLEMPIARLQAKWKMSQNRNEADRRGVVAGLDASGRDGDRAVAAAMKAAETGTSA